MKWKGVGTQHTMYFNNYGVWTHTMAVEGHTPLLLKIPSSPEATPRNFMFLYEKLSPHEKATLIIGLCQYHPFSERTAFPDKAT